MKWSAGNIPREWPSLIFTNHTKEPPGICRVLNLGHSGYPKGSNWVNPLGTPQQINQTNLNLIKGMTQVDNSAKTRLINQNQTNGICWEYPLGMTQLNIRKMIGLADWSNWVNPWGITQPNQSTKEPKLKQCWNMPRHQPNKENDLLGISELNQPSIREWSAGNIIMNWPSQTIPLYPTLEFGLTQLNIREMNR